MNLQNQLIEFAELHGLKEKALSAVENELEACIASDKEIGLDFMEGHERDELIYKFGSYNLETNHLDHCYVITKINIYTKNLYGPNFDVPVGYYREVTDAEGNHIDEYLNFDWSPVDLNVEDHFERINQTVPKQYFRRNTKQYEFVSYINHLLSLAKGKQYEGAIVFIRRSLNFLEKETNIETVYLNECLALFDTVFNYVKRNQEIVAEELRTVKIEKQLKEIQKMLKR